MSARDLFHDTVKNGLKNDGWKVTYDLYALSTDEFDLAIDLGSVINCKS
ncbi:element excision factor XisH family protein [Synechococcus sp. PCC 6312]